MRGADCSGNEPVLKNGEVVGTVSSGGFGHHVGESIALAYIDPQVNPADGDLDVEILGVMRRARIAPQTPFDPLNGRLRG